MQKSASFSKLLSRLRLNQLSLLCGVADGLSFRQLAERLALSQPAISKMARELELTLGQSVFLRERSGVKLTPLGVQLVHDAKLIIKHVSRIEQNVKNYQLGIGATIKIGAPSYTAVSLLSEPIAQLIRQHPDIQIQTIDGVADHLFELLETGEIDFLVGSLPTTTFKDELGALLQIETLYPDEVCLITQKSNIQPNETLNLQKLQRFSWIMPSEDSLVRQALRNTLLLEGLPIPKASVQSSVVPVIGALVAENENLLGALRADAAYYLAQRLNLAIIQMQTRIALPSVAIIRLQHTEPTPLTLELFTLIRKRVNTLFEK